MRSFVLVLGLSLAWSLVGCQPEQVPATQTIVRIDASPNVRAAMQKLRVRTSAQRRGVWEKRNDKVFTLDALRWPVDIVITPRRESEADKPFELIADALGGGDVSIVQARVLSGFVRRQQRILFATLSACPDLALGSLCEPDAECLGPSCLTCVDGRCAPTPVASPAALAPFTPSQPGDAATERVDGSVLEPGPDDAGGPIPSEEGGIRAEGGLDGGGLDAGADAAIRNDADMGMSGCDPGSEKNPSGVCLDIDECARAADDCDHDPQACVNAAPGFSCSCPTGYRGAGRGAGGCVDIDECAEQTDTCDALAACNNAPGGYACGSCPSGYGPGTSGSCVDINECTTSNGGCDTNPTATCNNQVGVANTCSCPAGYTGNGVGTSGCVDPCTPNPCGAGLSCARSPSATATCSATCAASGGLGCQPGDTCVSDADCKTGGDSNATCDATNKVCVTVCAATTISSAIHLTTARHCKEITGDLVLNPDFPTIASTDFPYLTRVRGAVTLGTASGNSVLQTVTLSALTAIDGALTGAFLTALTRLSLPRVTNLGGGTTLSIVGMLQQASFPQLRTVGGNWYWIGAQNLVQLDIGNLQSVTGMVSLQNLCKLPSTQVTRITGSGTPNLVNIGCCTSSLTSVGCGSGGCTCN